MKEAKMEVSVKQMKSYSKLREAVAKTLLEGQRKVEALKVETYWKTGKLIRRYLDLKPGSEAKDVLDHLADDLSIERSLFYRSLQFSDNFPRVATWRLSWSHYRELLAIPDKTRRLELAEKASSERWPVRMLQERIQKKRKPKAKVSKYPKPVEPERGKPGAVQVGWLKEHKGTNERTLDFGFAMYFEESPSKLKKFKAGDWVRQNKRAKWELAPDVRDHYYYEARLERVVDGDTLLVHVLLPNKMKRRQYLRLVGFDAPPLKTKAGERAKEQLASCFKKTAKLQFKSRFVDRYDRSLADVWVGSEYLNRKFA